MAAVDIGISTVGRLTDRQGRKERASNYGAARVRLCIGLLWVYLL